MRPTTSEQLLCCAQGSQQKVRGEAELEITMQGLEPAQRPAPNGFGEKQLKAARYSQV